MICHDEYRLFLTIMLLIITMIFKIANENCIIISIQVVKGDINMKNNYNDTNQKNNQRKVNNNFVIDTTIKENKNDYYKKKYMYSNGRDLFFLAEKNYISDLLELYGIYHAYCYENYDIDFKEYYCKKKKSRFSYKYRYYAQKKIKEILYLKGYKISRREIKFFSKTKYMESVRTSAYSDIIFYEIILQLLKETRTKELLCEIINELKGDSNKNISIQKFLKFQYVSVTRNNSNQYYDSGAKPLFIEVNKNWKEIINHLNNL